MTKHQIKLKKNRREVRNIQAVKNEGYKAAVDVLMVLPMYVLRKKFGFGEKRLAEYMREFNRIIDETIQRKIDTTVLAEELIQGTKIEYDSKKREWYFPNVKE